MSTRASTKVSKAATAKILDTTANDLESWISDEPVHVQAWIADAAYEDTRAAQRAINAVKRFLFLDLKSRADDWSLTVPGSLTADVLRLVAARERGEKLVPNTWA